MKPYLLVGIDTEGDNQWDLKSREHQTFENIYALPKLHTLFGRHGVRPTYVVTWPVASDERSQQVLRFLLLRGDCEIGAHHHAWETPPCSAEDVRAHRYASTLGLDQFEAQLAQLTAAIARAVGAPPISYRSGRFGFDASHVAALERYGYLVDSSVVPLFNESHKGGPDFSEAPVTPYFLAYDSAVRPGTSQVLEIPCSVALHRRVPPVLARAWARAPWPYMTRRVLRKLGVARLDWLRPSYSSFDQMCALARRLTADGVPCAEHHLPLERSDRRRQSVQPLTGRAGRFPRSARSVPAVRRDGAGRAARNVPGVPRELCRRPCGGGRFGSGLI